MTQNLPKLPARRWPWILGAGAVVVTAIVAVCIVLPTGVATPTASPTGTINTLPTATADPAPTSSLALDPIADAPPTGCIGGPKRDSGMVFSTLERAPRTSNGAVEVAASLVRWITQSPMPPAEDVREVQAAAVAAGSEIDLDSALTPGADMSNGAVPTGTDFYLSTAPGVWDVESSDADTVTVAVGTGFVIDGALSATQRGSATMTMLWQDEHWKLLTSSGSRPPAELFATGTAFTGGC